MQVTTMRARVLRVRNNSMLVYDQNGRQTVVVNTTEALRYRPGERVCILYSGAMTHSAANYRLMHFARRYLLTYPALVVFTASHSGQLPPSCFVPKRALSNPPNSPCFLLVFITHVLSHTKRLAAPWLGQQAF